MNHRSGLLEPIEIAAPCTANWDDMIGNEQVRFCGECKLNVYNLSGMTSVEAETLIQQNEGHLCVRFYQRADGKVLTQNCPVGLQTLHQSRRFRFKLAGVAAAITLITVVGLFTPIPQANAKTEGIAPSETLPTGILKEPSINNSPQQVPDSELPPKEPPAIKPCQDKNQAGNKPPANPPSNPSHMIMGRMPVRK